MIYSISDTSKSIFKNSLAKPLSESKLEPGSIYYYDRGDQGARGISFDRCLEEKHWKHLKNDITTKLIINYPDDYFHSVDIKFFCETIKTKQIDPSRIYFITLDELFNDFLKREMLKHGVVGVKTCPINIAILKTKSTKFLNIKRKKHRFSMLSRNYNDWRLKLYALLVNLKQIKYFNYSFSNINPYSSPPKTFDISYLKNILIDNGYQIDKELESWLNRIPYQLGNVADKFSDVTYQAIEDSDIHVLIESHFNPFQNYHGPDFRNMISEDLSPAFFTEKTYKVLSREKPFLIFATPNSLSDLRKLGYKTFSPYIDETYDTIEDNDMRLEAIVREIKRINSLSEKDYQSLLKNCSTISKYNRKNFLKQRDRVNYCKDTIWMYPLLNFEIRKLFYIRNFLRFFRRFLSNS